MAAFSDVDQLAHAKNLYYQGIYGDKAAQSESDALFAALHRELPENPVASAYFGSLRLIEAAHTWALWRKNALSREGITLMDKAVAAAPQSLEVRFVRGATERELPSFFGRKQQAQDDIAAIVKSSHVAESQLFEPHLAAASFYYYGLDRHDAGNQSEALEAWRNAVRIAPQSHAGRLAAQKLKALL